VKEPPRKRQKLSSQTVEISPRLLALLVAELLQVRLHQELASLTIKTVIVSTSLR